MTKAEVREWIYNEFSPTRLSIGATVIDQQYDNAVRYWNTHSAYKFPKMINYDGSSNFVTLTTDIKNVVQVYPSVMQEELFSNHPMWALLGFITLDKYTSDLIMLSQAFEGYRIYLGTDFRYKYVRSTDQDNTPGQLYLQNVPRGAYKLAVVGLKWILPSEEVTDGFILNWLMYYQLSLCKAKEGNVLRKADIIGVQNDGQRMLDEGLEEAKILQETLAKESRWALLAARK